MKILMDECLPKRLARVLTGHDVKTTPQMNKRPLTMGMIRKLHLALGLSADLFIQPYEHVEAAA